ncbi:AmpG family muropeptide MFS transporter [Arenimonas soli]|uniref:AmpG family muropeptide MFS transporter n=1 Tax=Arenimonas soli TaxID=2269504 RepID=UPI003CCE018A
MSASTTVPPPRGWRGVLSAFGTPSALTMCLLGFGSGLPFLLVGYVLSIWLREAGYDLGLIGLLSYIGLFYALKFVWAPLVDRYPLPWLGRRRGWLFASQLLLAVGLAGMALLGPGAGLPLFILLAGVAAFAGATQDIAVDAYRIEIAPVEAQGALAATYTLGYRLGLIASTVGVLYVAEFWDWRVAYLAMAALMIPPLLTTLVAREPESTIPLGPRGGFVQAFVGPFVEFFRRNGWVLAVALLAFVGLYKLPDQMLGVIAGPYYLDSGFDKAQIANISKLYGVPIGIAGAFVGGMTVAAIGLRWSLAVAAVAVALSNLLFILMSVHPGELWSFMAAISGDNFSQGFAGTVLVAFMSALANRSYTATQYALLGSLANLPGKLIGGVSGFMVEASSYTAFFIFSTLSIVPTLLLLVWLWPRLAPRSAA